GGPGSAGDPARGVPVARARPGRPEGLTVSAAVGVYPRHWEADVMTESAYPRHWEADVVAADGGGVHRGPSLPGVAAAVVESHARLSPPPGYLRFFGPYPRIPPADLERFTVVDHHDRVAFVGWLGREIVAVGRYVRLADAASAEVAFVVR